jgi:hypothetical protein
MTKDELIAKAGTASEFSHDLRVVPLEYALQAIAAVSPFAETLPPSIEPAIVGRIPAPWMVANMHRISRDDFYDQTMTEGDLKRKYGNSPPFPG